MARSKRCRFLLRFGATGGTAPRDLGATVRGLDRGLLVLVPHQRPAQRLGPEEPDLPGAVAGELAEAAAAGQEGVAGLDHAELVALGIGQHDVSLFRELSDVEMAGAELERRRDGVLLVAGAGAGQVEVDKPQAELGVGRGQQRTPGVVEDLPSQDTCPEARQAGRVVRIEGQGQQSGGHPRTLDGGQELQHAVFQQRPTGRSCRVATHGLRALDLPWQGRAGGAELIAQRRREVRRRYRPPSGFELLSQQPNVMRTETGCEVLQPRPPARRRLPVRRRPGSRVEVPAR